MAVTINGTTGIAGVDGSASTPAVQGTDTNTGLFFGTDTVTIATGGTTAVTVDSGQRTKFPTTIGVGGATPSTSGSGITFPATQSASSDANTLDDYEEGTFTPTLSSGFSVAPTSYTWQAGRYTKIGRFVYFEIDLDPNGATASATGLEFGGLPFTSAGVPYGGAFVVYQSSFNTNAGDSFIVASSNTTIITYTNAGVARAGNAANVNINNRIAFSGWYTT